MSTSIGDGTIYAGKDIRQMIKLLPASEAQHMRRVGILTGILAAEIHEHDSFSGASGLNGYSYFGDAAAYHDIGKAWVPGYILAKPGELTEEETAIVKRHPIFARDLFERINSGSITGVPKHLIKLASHAAVYHHEWWNGNGYPYEINADNIPLIARITSVCDAYDAITHDRSFRKSRSHYYACSELDKCAGTQFDPKIVKVFLDHERVFLTLNV